MKTTEIKAGKNMIIEQLASEYDFDATPIIRIELGKVSHCIPTETHR